MLLKSLMDRSGGRPIPTSPSPNLQPDATVATRLADDLIIKKIKDHDYQMNRKRFTDDYIHVSSLRDVCPRQYALMVKLGEPVYDRVNTNDKLLWAIGRAVESHVRDSFIASVEYKNVFGGWTCPCKKSVHTGFYNEREVCEFCLVPRNRYREVTLFDHDNRIAGNPDIVYVVDGKYVPIEIKSVRGGESANKTFKSFKQLDTPLGDHIFQVQMYRYLLQKNGYPVSDEVIVIYGNKEYSFKDFPLKQFNVDVSQPEYEAAVTRAVESARAIFAHLNDGEPLPPRLSLCTSSSDKKPSTCPVVGRCFA